MSFEAPSAKVIFLMLVASALLGGMLSVLTLICLIWLSNLGIAVEATSKHGISSNRSRRLGGIAILFSITLYYFSLMFADVFGLPTDLTNQPFVSGYVWFVL